MLRAARYPDLYHGWGQTRDYFEGWYFKLVDPTEQHVLALIPGISLARDERDSHSFVQVVNGSSASLDYLRYPVTAFRADRRQFAVTVGQSQFSLEAVSLDAVGAGGPIRGLVTLRNVQRWPDSLISPGSMGLYNYLPRMQCYSQVCAMDMDLKGELLIDGVTVDFSGGRGYIEKNWGRAFPFSWVWLQCNNFGAERVSLSCSLGHIPVPWGAFRGFLVGITQGGRFHAFTTMNRSRAKVRQDGADVAMEFWNRQHHLAVGAHTDPAKFVLLPGPRDGRMVPLVQENLLGTAFVRLTETSSGQVLFEGEGRCAGVEYGGEQMLVLDDLPDGVRQQA